MFSISSSQDNSQYGGGLAHSGVHRLKILVATMLHFHSENTTATCPDNEATNAMFCEGKRHLPLFRIQEKTIKQTFFKQWFERFSILLSIYLFAMFLKHA